MTSKIVKINEILNIKECSLTYGHFDTIHPGHIRYLKYAKSINKFLIVAIIGDKEKNNSPRFQFNQNERSEAIAMLDLADFILKLEEDELSQIVEKIKPNALVLGKEKEFEDVWKNRDTHLNDVPGFKEFHLVKGDTNDEHTLYASHSIWNSKNDFINWTKSEAFRLAHKNSGQHKCLYLGHPNFEGFEVVI